MANDNIREQIDRLEQLIGNYEGASNDQNRLRAEYLEDINKLYDNYTKLLVQGGKEELKSKTTMGQMVELQTRRVKNAVEYGKLQKDNDRAAKKIAELDKRIAKERKKGNMDNVKALTNEKVTREINLEKQKVATNLLKKSTGYSNNLLKVLGPMGMVFNGMLTALKVIKGVFNFLIKEPFKMFLKMQELTGNLSADLGMSLGLTIQLQDNFSEMVLQSMAFGGSMEDIIAITKRFSETIGRNRLFNNDDLLAINNIGKSLGLGVERVSHILAQFDIINLGVKGTTELINYSMEQATKYGLNATKLVNNVVDVFEQFKGFRFTNGLKDLTDMAAKAQMLRFNLDNMRSLSDNLFNVENAVEMSAKLRVLGGNVAQIADPFMLMFQGMSDQAGLLDTVLDSVSGKAQRNADGLFSIPPAQRQVINNIAEILGQDRNELMGAALEQAKLIDKMSTASLSMLNDDDKKAIANMMYFDKNEKSYMVNINGIYKKAQDLTKTQIDKMLKEARINESAARGRQNFVDRLREYGARIQQAMTNVFLPFYQIFDRGSAFETQLSKMISSLSTNLSDSLKSIFGSGSGFTDLIRKVMTGISNSVKNITEFINEVRGEGSFWNQIKKIGVAAMKELVPAMKFAISEVFKVLTDNSRTMKFLFGGLAEMGANDPATQAVRNMVYADDFIYSNKHGLTKFRKDDLVMGGTSILNNYDNNTTTQPTNITLQVSGTLKVESSDNSYTFTKDELKDIGLTQLATLIKSEMDKIERGTLKNTPSMKVKPING